MKMTVTVSKCMAMSRWTRPQWAEGSEVPGTKVSPHLKKVPPHEITVNQSQHFSTFHLIHGNNVSTIISDIFWRIYFFGSGYPTLLLMSYIHPWKWNNLLIRIPARRERLRVSAPYPSTSTSARHHKKEKKEDTGVAQELIAFCLLKNEEDPNFHQTISNCARLMEGGIIVDKKDTEGKKTKGIDSLANQC